MMSQTNVSTLMKKFWPLVLIAGGGMLLLASVVYGVVFAGIPGPDDSPSQLARQEFHGNIAFVGILLGGLILLTGGAAGITKWIRWWIRGKP